MAEGHPEGTAFQSNFKILAGLHNVYATNGGDYLEQLDFFEAEALPKLVSIEQKIAASVAVAERLPVAPAAQQPPVGAPMVSPQQAPAAPVGGHVCGCGLPMRYVAAGVSKATGRPYPAFYTCSVGKPEQGGCGKRINVT